MPLSHLKVLDLTLARERSNDADVGSRAESHQFQEFSALVDEVLAESLAASDEERCFYFFFEAATAYKRLGLNAQRLRHRLVNGLSRT